MWTELEQEHGVKKGFYAKYFKRAFDFTATAVGLVCISPIFLSLCALVRIKFLSSLLKNELEKMKKLLK